MVNSLSAYLLKKQMTSTIFTTFFLISLCSIANASNLKSRVKTSLPQLYYFTYERNGHCVGISNGQPVLSYENCSSEASRWESIKKGENIYSLRNYSTGLYLTLDDSNSPKLVKEQNKNSLFLFSFIHTRSRVFPNNSSYWYTPFYNVGDPAFKMCLGVVGNSLSKVNCIELTRTPFHLGLMSAN